MLEAQDNGCHPDRRGGVLRLLIARRITRYRSGFSGETGEYGSDTRGRPNKRVNEIRDRLGPRGTIMAIVIAGMITRAFVPRQHPATQEPSRI